MQHQQQQSTQSSNGNSANRTPKFEDGKRIQRVLDELSAKYTDRKNGPQQIVMEEKAKQMLAEYANELTASVLEAASMLAEHRNSKTIDVEDVNLILRKKLGIDLTAFSSLKQQQTSTTSESVVVKTEAVKSEPHNTITTHVTSEQLKL